MSTKLVHNPPARASRDEVLLDAVLFLSFFISGCSALIYQVCWQRSLYGVIGVDMDSITIIVSVFMLGIGFVASLFFVVMLFMRGADASVESLKRAQNSPQVKAALGEPIAMDWWVMGSFSSTAEEGQANLTIPVSGPRGSASIQTEATKQQGTWRYTRMSADLPSGETIDLLQPLPSP